jgi:ABC-type polar amino acid transport system ATPase subunit
LERVYYSAEGLSKFQQMVQQGMLQVASGGAGSGEATIYRVLQ